jgi:hypothetical protein
MCVESIQYVESLKNVVDDVFEVSEKPTNCVSRWWFVESAIVHKTVLKFSYNRMCAVDVPVIAVQKATKEIRRLMDSCSAPSKGGEHLLLQQKLELKILEQRYCLGSRDIQEVVYRSYVLQGCACVGHTLGTLLIRM